MRNIYWYVALASAAIVSIIIIQYLINLITLVWGAYKLHAGRKHALARMRNLKPGEPLEPQLAVSPEPPPQVSAEVQPILEHAGPLEAQPATSPEPPPQVSAEVQPILEHAEPLEAQPATSPEPPPQVSAEVQPILEHAEPLEAQPATSPEPSAQAGAEVQPILEHAEALEPQATASPELPVQAGAEVRPILEHAEALEPQATASPELPVQAGVEVRPILERGEPLEAQPAARPEPLAQAVAEVQPILEHAEALEPQATVSPELPAQAGTEVRPILERGEPLKPQATVRPELPAQAGTEVRPILERRESLKPQPAMSSEPPPQAGTEVPPIREQREPLESQAVSANGCTAQNDYDRSVVKDNEATKLDPKFVVAYKNHSVTTSKSGDKSDFDADLAAPKTIQARDSGKHVKLGRLAEANGKKVAALTPREESTSEDQSAANEARAVKGWLGVSLRQVTEGAAQTLNVRPDYGALVVSLNEDSPAKPASIEPADVIVKFDGKDIKVDADADLAAPKAIQARESGKHVKLGRLAEANGKKAAALTPEEESTSEDQSAANEVRAVKGWLGVSLRQVTEHVARMLNVRPNYGALVASLNENSPAKPAGIEPGDVVVNFDGKDIEEWRDLPRIITDTPAGKEVAITIIRKGKELTKAVKVGQPEDADRQASFTLKNESSPQEKPMRKVALGLNIAASAALGRVPFGRRKAMPASH
jgi:PDZ domain-containing secreted protein